MTRACVLVLMLVAACTPPAVRDPNAVGPRYDRWDAVVAVSSASAYGAVLAVLNDSSYTIARADAASGVVETRPRKESDVQRGTQQLKTMLVRSNYPVTLRVLVSPVGRDSSLVSISGDYTLENIGQSGRIDARSSEWHFVAGIGAAVLSRARSSERSHHREGDIHPTVKLVR